MKYNSQKLIEQTVKDTFRIKTSSNGNSCGRNLDYMKKINDTEVIFCKQTVERKSNGVWKYYYADCGAKAKYKVTYNKRQNVRDAEPVEETKFFCGRHFNVFKKFQDKFHFPYTVEEI
jgi:hypothetical protein